MLTRTEQKQFHADMTQGSVARHLIVFALPLLAGNAFQQLYNTVDAWVVGNYVSNEAFSAVGAVAPVVNMLIGAFTGLSSGAGVVISQYFGARDEGSVRRAVHTSVLLTAILAVLFSLLGVGLTPLMLRLMRTPGDVFLESSAYLVIYFSGMAGLMFYNMCSAILRAVGDSRRPFYYLVAAAIINTALDLLFVIGFQMGVRGVAAATVIAQAISAALALAALLRTNTCIRLEVRALRLHRDILAQIIRVGVPAAFQMSLIAISNVFSQSYINQFGKECMGGWTIYSKVDQFIYLPMQSLSLAVTTFVGQNLGGGQPRRAALGVGTSMVMATGCTVVLASSVFAAAPRLAFFFNQNPEVIEYGVLFMRHIVPFHFFSCLNLIYTGALRGAGNTKTPMLILIGTLVVFRLGYLYIVSNYISNTLVPLVMCYPIGWILGGGMTFFYYRRVHLKQFTGTDREA